MTLYYKPVDLGDLTELTEVAIKLFYEQKDPSRKFKFYTFANPENRAILEEILAPKIKKMMRNPTETYAVLWGHIPPMGDMPIHVDTHPNGRVTVTPGLNIPLINSSGGVTKWYAGDYRFIDQGPDAANRTQWGRTKLEWTGEPQVAAEHRVTDPIWMNTCVPHSAENPTNDFRLLLGVKFSADFTIEDA